MKGVDLVAWLLTFCFWCIVIMSALVVVTAVFRSFANYFIRGG
jgi:hypothetical protein